MAAHHKGYFLSQTFASAGKHYNSEEELISDEAIYSGKGVVQDGNLVTSSLCPYLGSLDQFIEHTQTLITLLQK